MVQAPSPSFSLSIYPPPQSHITLPLPHVRREAASTRVGNWLGANEPANARLAAYLSMIVGVIESAILCTKYLITFYYSCISHYFLS